MCWWDKKEFGSSELTVSAKTSEEVALYKGKVNPEEEGTSQQLMLHSQTPPVFFLLWETQISLELMLKSGHLKVWLNKARTSRHTKCEIAQLLGHMGNFKKTNTFIKNFIKQGFFRYGFKNDYL